MWMWRSFLCVSAVCGLALDSNTIRSSKEQPSPELPVRQRISINTAPYFKRGTCISFCTRSIWQLDLLSTLYIYSLVSDTNIIFPKIYTFVVVIKYRGIESVQLCPSVQRLSSFEHFYFWRLSILVLVYLTAGVYLLLLVLILIIIIKEHNSDSLYSG